MSDRRWDADAVRVEFHDAMTFGGSASPKLAGTQSAAIYLPDDEGKFRARKPALTLLADTRPELLRQLADWIEQEGDPSLRAVVAQRDALVDEAVTT